MSVTLTTRPTYPLPGKTPVSVACSSGNFARLWCTNAPRGSDLRAKLDKAAGSSGAVRVEVFAGDEGTNVWTPLLDVGGVYTFAAQEYTKGASTFGGGYQGDPDSFPTETKVGSETTLYLYVGQRVQLRFGTARDAALLTCWVWNDRIRPTTLIEHGVETPVFEPRTAKARAAAEVTDAEFAVGTLLSADSATTIVGTLATMFNALRVKFDAHLTQAGKHDADDGDNALGVSYDTPATTTALLAAVNTLRSRIARHFTNDEDGSGPGSAGADYHVVAATVVSDWTNHPIADPASDVESAGILLADLYRAYNAHRVSTAVHAAADSTNVPTTPSTLNLLHQFFLAYLAALNPTAPATQNSGTAALFHSAGALETTPRGTR